MKIPSPFIPLRISTSGLEHTVEIVGRKYVFGADAMISSIVTQGKEILAGPMRIVSQEDGEAAIFDEAYPENESESFIQSRSDEEAVICGCKQTQRFIVDFCNTIHFDGNIDIDFKLMTKGHTVAQVFGMSGIKPLRYKLDYLWLEIPLKKELFTLYHMFPNSSMIADNGKVYTENTTSTSGAIPRESVALPFRPLLWLGNEELGIGFFAENNRYWQNSDEKKAIEIIQKEKETVLRIRLLDSHPSSWKGDFEKGAGLYTPIDFHFGFHVTPVKPFPENPYLHRALHLDCGTKIKGNYMDYLSCENRFDLLKEKGVTTLILHEKWNKSQNWFSLSEYTANQLKYIVDECHKRDIKVMPYFGYELSAMSPVWSDIHDKVLTKYSNGRLDGGWWRVPFQRDYCVCYNSDYADYFVEGIKKIMDEYNIDGVYLDGSARPTFCSNTEHGCGWYDENGALHGSYSIKAIRRLFQKLHKVVKERGGHINVHTFAAVNFTALPYIDQNWFGENLQFDLMKGSSKDVDLDYFRAEYSGRNMGVPVEFIVYENRPLWQFENALAISLLHGILPRPNHIGHPLEVMSKVWDIIEKFPVEKSEWLPYWKNNAKTSNPKIKVSYYKYTDVSGDASLLVFISNVSPEEISSVKIQLEEEISYIKDLTSNTTISELSFDIKGHDYKMLFIK